MQSALQDCNIGLFNPLAEQPPAVPSIPFRALQRALDRCEQWN